MLGHIAAMARYPFSVARWLALKAGLSSATRISTLAMGTLLLMAAMLALFAGLTINASKLERLAEEWADHTREVLERTAEIESATNATIRGERGYLLTQDETFLEPYHQGEEDLRRSLAELQVLASDDPMQASRVEQLAQRVDDYLAVVSSIIAAENAGRHGEAVQRVRAYEGRQSIRAIMQELAAIDEIEERVLTRRTAQAQASKIRSQRLEYLLGSVGILLLALGAVATLALRRSLLREAAVRSELHRIATTDELTGLANRHELFSSLDRMIATSRRSSRPLSLAILDIDRFKLVNDLHGHPAGDEVIRLVSEMALAMMREQDLVGRLGGEEFVIAFPDCSAAFAVAACERLREGVAALPILLADGKSLRITISFGVAQLQDDDRTRLISRADEALYRAKKGGRNQVYLAA